MEDPGFHVHRRVLEDTGMSPLPVPVDSAGIDVEALARSDAVAALVTPAHQSPTGVALAPERRTALVGWARPDRVIIEDDYDAEFRYDRAPVGALQGLAPDHVVYAGSASKTLAPGLRLGWLVLPEALVDTGPSTATAVASKRSASVTAGSSCRASGPSSSARIGRFRTTRSSAR